MRTREPNPVVQGRFSEWQEVIAAYLAQCKRYDQLLLEHEELEAAARSRGEAAWEQTVEVSPE